MNLLWIRQKLLESKTYWPILRKILEDDDKILDEIEVQLKAERLFEILT